MMQSMGLFQKRDDATCRGVIVAALGGSLLGIGFVALISRVDPMWQFTTGFAVYGAIAGAVCTAAIYWNGFPD
jgi:hypothetical protein